jgi:hypothetical protein
MVDPHKSNVVSPGLTAHLPQLIRVKKCHGVRYSGHKTIL